jgi:hypothetical protein
MPNALTLSLALIGFLLLALDAPLLSQDQTSRNFGAQTRGNEAPASASSIPYLGRFLDFSLAIDHSGQAATRQTFVTRKSARAGARHLPVFGRQPQQTLVKGARQ